MLLVASLLQQVVEGCHSLVILEVHIGAQLQQFVCGGELVRLNRRQERRRLLGGGILRAVLDEETYGRGIISVHRGPQAVVRIRPAPQQVLRQGGVLTPGDRVPERCSLPGSLRGRRLIDVYASIQKDLCGPDTLGWLGAPLPDVDAAAMMQPVTSLLVAERDKQRILTQARVDVHPTKVPHEVKQACLRDDCALWCHRGFGPGGGYHGRHSGISASDPAPLPAPPLLHRVRKSTRLNSSHRT